MVTLPATEVEMGAAILDAARLGGWMVYHQRPARTARGWRTALQGDPGWPDWVLCRPPELLFIETKTDKGRVSEAQQRWLDALSACDLVEVRVVRPENLDYLLERLLHRPGRKP